MHRFRAGDIVRIGMGHHDNLGPDMLRAFARVGSTLKIVRRTHEMGEDTYLLKRSWEGAEQGEFTAPDWCLELYVIGLLPQFRFNRDERVRISRSVPREHMEHAFDRSGVLRLIRAMNERQVGMIDSPSYLLMYVPGKGVCNLPAYNMNGFGGVRLPDEWLEHADNVVWIEEDD